VVTLKYTGEYGKYCDVWQSAVTVIRSRKVTEVLPRVANKELVTLSVMVWAVGTPAAPRLKMIYLHVIMIIHWWNLVGIDMAFTRQKFYKVTSGKSIRRSLTVMAFSAGIRKTPLDLPAPAEALPKVSLGLGQV